MSGFTNVVVVGAGLIGGSFAKRLHGLGCTVTVVDPDPGTRGQAAGLGLQVAEVVPSDADLVVLAGPLDTLPAALRGAASAAPDAVVIDVGSVKAPLAAAASDAGLSARYVGCHPMSGTEFTGFERSTDDLLVGVTWAVTYGSPRVTDVVSWLVDTFDATVAVLDAADHDRAVALVSHVPHALANALLAVVAAAPSPAARHLAAGSFRDGTRVAGRNPERTLNMLAENALPLGDALDAVIAELLAYRRELDDSIALRARVEHAAADGRAVREARVEWQSTTDLGSILLQDHPVLVRSGKVTRFEHAELT